MELFSGRDFDFEIITIFVIFQSFSNDNFYIRRSFNGSRICLYPTFFFNFWIFYYWGFYLGTLTRRFFELFRFLCKFYIDKYRSLRYFTIEERHFFVNFFGCLSFFYGFLFHESCCCDLYRLI